MPRSTQLAIFVGGKSRRMGTAKGLLGAPGASQTILEALVERGRTAGIEPVLVGDASPYEGLAAGVARIADDPPDAGPLGGLHAVLRHAQNAGHAYVIAVACDMPNVTVEVLEELRDHPSDVSVVAPRRGPNAPWEPMLARYDARQLASVVADAIARGHRSFQGLFSELEVLPLELGPAVQRALADWDTPDDVVR